MNFSTKHWAAPLIGLPWEPGAQGPNAFDCWGLVRHVFRIRYGIDMPQVQVGDFAEGDNVAALKRAAAVSGWKRIEAGAPQDGDVVLMQGPVGRHVGVMIASIRGLRLLHADGHMTARGPVGSVVAVPLDDAKAGGYGQVEIWRLAP